MRFERNLSFPIVRVSKRRKYYSGILPDVENRRDIDEAFLDVRTKRASTFHPSRSSWLNEEDQFPSSVRSSYQLAIFCLVEPILRVD